MSIAENVTTAQKFEQAIVREALTFAQKVLILSDPTVQKEHEEGLADIKAGRGISFADLQKKYGLDPR